MMTPHTSTLLEEFSAGTLEKRDALLDRLRSVARRTPFRRRRSLRGYALPRAGLLQRRDDETVTELPGPVERGLAVAVARIHVGARLQKSLYNSDILILRCDGQQQRRHPSSIPGIHVCARVYQGLDQCRRSRGSRP